MELYVIFYIDWIIYSKSYILLAKIKDAKVHFCRFRKCFINIRRR